MNKTANSGGFILRIKGPDHYVMDQGEEIRCSVRGRFRIGKNPAEGMPVVGDNVEYRRGTAENTGGAVGLILSIGPRKSIFARTGSSEKRRYKVLCANLDLVFLVHSARDPVLNLRLLDRMLVAAESGRMEPVICINKMDLGAFDDEIDSAMEVYRKMSYRVVLCSARDGRGIDELASLMRSRRSIMSGPSGAGKTSLLGMIEPGLEARIGAVSERTGKGRHTTTHFELHPLRCGGFLGDTPGIREFGIWEQSKQTLGGCFRDFDPWRSQCRFASCTHSHEPGCAVKEAVGEGLVSKERYESYLKILQDLPDLSE